MKQTKKSEPEPRRVLVGMNAIETYLKRSTATLISWRNQFDFPLEKINGEMTLDLNRFEVWAKEWEFTKSSSASDFEALRLRNTQAERLRQIPNRTLIGFVEMGEFAGGRGLPTMIKWARDFVDWPGQKNEQGQPTVNSRDFQLFLERHGIRRDASQFALRRAPDAV